VTQASRSRVTREGRLHELTAGGIAAGVSAGRFSAESVVRDCLARIAAREPEVKAWAALDAEFALGQARSLDTWRDKGPLAGVTVGVKDIIDTADLTTEMGSPIYRGHRPAVDAACVAQLRAAGAIVLGKTVTCEFAGLTPSETCNPHNLAHTPGGSSSGSAAAVADDMVHVALGTQTGGSVLRPASFCGVVGYKPSFGLISRQGIKFAAESRDTIGLFARNVEDVDLVASVLTDRAAVLPRQKPPRIGLCRTHLWEHAGAETRHAVEDAAERLGAAGAELSEVGLPESFCDLSLARTVINPVERARALTHEWNTNRELISDRLRRQVEDGLTIPYARYIAALRMIKERRDELSAVFDGVDVLLAPCVDGEAPEGYGWTGEPRFQEFWTALHVPTLSLPTHGGAKGLPVGIQLVAPLYADEVLLSVASWVLERLGRA
jgi:Asp-tRNA(Asn)/Glu-tRNA(Gln) amidotransferase A subunit family amidase